MRRILFVIAVLLCARSAFGMEKYQDWCQQGGQTVTTSGIVSTTFVQRSFKTCTITVYSPSGQTSTLATLYSDDGVTPLANPFTNQNTSTGQFFFYTANAVVDIRIAATGLTTYTLGAVNINDSATPAPCVTTATFSATPAFNAAACSVFQITLTGNVTSSSISNATTGRMVWFKITQDGTGGRTFAWPVNLSAYPALDYGASAVTSAQFYYDGTTWRGVGFQQGGSNGLLTSGAMVANQYIFDYSNHSLMMVPRSNHQGVTFEYTSSPVAINGLTLSIFPNTNGASQGIFEVEGLNDSSAAVSTGGFEAFLTDSTAGSEDSEMRFQQLYAGAQVIPLRMTPSVMQFFKPTAPFPSNWETLEFAWETDIAAIYANKTGSGTLRELQFGGSAGSHFFSMPAAGGFNPTNDNAASSTMGSTSLRWKSLDLGTGGLRIGANNGQSGQLWSAADGNNETILGAAGAGSSPYLEFKLTRGTFAAKTTTVSGDTLSYIQSYGYDGSNFLNSTSIVSTIDAAVGAGHVPGRIDMSTMTAGGSLTGALRIDSLQNSVFNVTGSNLAQGATGNFIYIPVVATGKPNGTPSRTYTGTVPFVYDTTNNEVCVYTAAWHCSPAFSN